MVRAGTLRLGDGRESAVAVKMIDAAADAQQREMLSKEVEIHARVTLKCSGVCRLLGTAVKDGRMCVVMTRRATSLAGVPIG